MSEPHTQVNIDPHAGSTARRSIALGVLLVVVTAGIGAFTLLRGERDTGESVRTALVQKHGVTSRVLAQGKIRARTQVEVASEIGGRVSVVAVKVGDTVKKGELLFAIDDEQLKNAVEQLKTAQATAEAMQKRAELTLGEAQRNEARDRGLVDKGVLAADQLKLSETRTQLAVVDAQQAKASIDRAHLDLQRALDSLARARVKAPTGGTVVAVGVEVGQVVAPATGLMPSDSGSSLLPGMGGSSSTAPVIIADLSELITKLDIDELDVGQVKPGQHVVVKAQGIRDLQFAGTVERVGLMGREQSGAVLFVVEVAVNDTQPLPAKPSAVAEAHPAAPTSLPRPRDILRPGMSAQAEIEVQHIDDAIVVPVACVLEATGGESGKSDRVFVVDGDGKRLVAHEVAVKLGPSEDDGIVVTQGLQEGQRVVEGPYRALRALEDGDRVTLDDGKSDKHDDDASNKSGSKPNKKGKG